jgi:hypothetical protein
LEARYGETYGEALTVMGRLRDGMLSLGWESARIQKVLAEIYADGVVEVVASHDAGALTAFLRRRLGPAFPIEGSV